MNKDLVFEIKPTFNNLVRFFSINLFNASLITYGVVVLFFFFPLFFNKKMNSDIDFYILITIIVLTVSLIILLWLDKKNYEVTSYKLFADRIEFEEGFINHKSTTVKLEDIKEIHYSQNFFQRLANLGSVKLITAANSVSRNSGIILADIQNSNYIYRKIKEVQQNNKH